MFTLTILKKEYIKEKDDIHWLAAVIAPQVHFFAHGQYASDDRRADRHTRGVQERGFAPGPSIIGDDNLL